MTQILIYNLKVGVLTLLQTWAKTINYINKAGKVAKKLNAETAPVTLLCAKMENAKSKTPVTNKLNTQLQNKKLLHNLLKIDKCNKIHKTRIRMRLIQQNQSQLKRIETFGKLGKTLGYS